MSMMASEILKFVTFTEAIIYNPERGIWRGVGGYNRVGRGFGSIISNCACFLAAIVSVWWCLEGGLGVGLRLHPHLTFF